MHMVHKTHHPKGRYLLLHMAGVVYGVTGPPENFMTGMTIGYWALNEHDIGIW